MAEATTDTAERMAAMARMLPDDPSMASVEALAFGAAVSIQAGLSDEEATGLLNQALREMRECGLGEERH